MSFNILSFYIERNLTDLITQHVLSYSCIAPHFLQNFEDCLSMVPQLMQYFFSIEVSTVVDLLFILSP